MESSLSAFLLEGSNEALSFIRGPGLIETPFIRKGGRDVGRSRICAPLLWLSQVREDEIEDREGVNVQKKSHSLCPGGQERNS